MKTGGIKEYIFLIAGVIYVLLMFPSLYFFTHNPAGMYGSFQQNIILISEGGAFLFMLQLLVGAIYAPNKKKDV